MVRQRDKEGSTQLQRALNREQDLRKELENKRRKYANLVWSVNNSYPGVYKDDIPN
jgi:hypothetical protein